MITFSFLSRTKVVWFIYLYFSVTLKWSCNMPQNSAFVLGLFSQDVIYNNVASAILEPSCFILLCFWYLLLPSLYAFPSYFCLNVSIHSIDLVLRMYVLLFWILIMSSWRLMASRPHNCTILDVLQMMQRSYFFQLLEENCFLLSSTRVAWGCISKSNTSLSISLMQWPGSEKSHFSLMLYFFPPCHCKQIRNVTVDGGFGAWSGWSTCSHNDGGSAGSCLCRTRACDNPAPQCGGQQCHGISVEVANCSR